MNLEYWFVRAGKRGGSADQTGRGINMAATQLIRDLFTPHFSVTRAPLLLSRKLDNSLCGFSHELVFHNILYKV